MSAQFEFLFYSFLSIVLFPLTLFHFVIVKTALISEIKPFIVVSGSMEPSIFSGSLIYVLKKNTYQKGDVITFRQGNLNISHRIIEIKNLGSQRYYVTRGDSNKTSDENLILQSDIYGKVEVVIPSIGKAALALKSFAT